MPKKKIDKPVGQKAVVKKPDSSAVFDVAKPGSTPASPNSRPIILGHQTGLGQDPLLAKSPGDNSSVIASAEPRLNKQKKISPLSDNQENQTSPEADKAKSTQDQEAENEDKDTSTESSDTLDTSSSSAEIDALANEADAVAQAKKNSKTDNQPDPAVQKLIESNKYHVPITEGGCKAASERIVSWLLIFLLVVAVGVWLAIDAGYLDIGIDLPYDIIKNKG